MIFKRISIGQTMRFGLKFICTKFGIIKAAGVQKMHTNNFRYYGLKREKKIQNGAELDPNKNSKKRVAQTCVMSSRLFVPNLVQLR